MKSIFRLHSVVSIHAAHKYYYHHQFK